MEIGKSYLTSYLNNSVWMITPTVLDSMLSVVKSKLAGDVMGQLNSFQGDVDTSVIETYTDSIGRNTVVLNISGIMVPKASFIEKACMGFTSTHELRQTFKGLVNDSSVQRIILNLDTPGGNAVGVKEFAELVYQSRDKKEIVAYTNTVMTSAGYYIGSAASKVYATPSSAVVNIGTYSTIIKMKENKDFDVHIIGKGDLKAAGHPYLELTEKEESFFRGRTEKLYNQFVEDVAKYRGLEKPVIDQTESRFYNAEEVVGNFIDGLMTEDELL